MGRWEPNARGRLEQAAMSLYAEHGFEQTTVAEIAARAGLTERTFFRHFTDKREVLFAGAEELKAAIVTAVTDAPADRAPLAAVVDAVIASTSFFTDAHARSRRRWDLLCATPELMERERNKMAVLAVACAEALRARGVPEPHATMAGEIGMAVFRTAYERWIVSDGGRPFAEYAREAERAVAQV